MMVEEHVAKIARRIKNRRLALKLSIREMARITGASPSTIQKIESNEMVPTIAMLMKVAKGLNTNVTSFFEEETKPREVALVRMKERETIELPASKLRVEDLGSSIVDGKLDAALLIIEEGGNSGRQPLLHEGEEVKFCLEGKIAYRVDEEEYYLEPGDCIHFKSGRPHYWKNLNEGKTKVLSVVFNLPMFNQTKPRANGH